MAFRVSGKNMDIGDALRSRVGSRVAEATAKYFVGGYSGHVTIGKDGFGFLTECAVHLDSGITLQAQGMAADAYSSADQAALRIEKQLRRYNRRLKGHAPTLIDGLPVRAAAPRHVEPELNASPAATVVEETAPDPDVGADPVVVAESVVALERLSVREAVRALDTIGVPVIVFRHAAHGRVNIVYRRADGHVGWLDPPAN